MFKCTLQTPTTGRDASYKLNVVAEAQSRGQRVGRIIIVTLPWNETMGGYNTPDTMVESIKVDHKTRMWANAQRDGRPAEHRWRPLFNAAKFG